MPNPPEQSQIEPSLLRLKVPEVRDGDLYLLIPACADSCTIRAGAQSWGPLPPSWTEQRFAIPTGVSEVELHLTPAPNDPLGGFLPAIEAPPRGIWQGHHWEIGGPVRWNSRPALRWVDNRLQLHGGLIGHQNSPSLSSVVIKINGHTCVASAENLWLSPEALPEPKPWSPQHPDSQIAQVDLFYDGKLCASEPLPIVHHQLTADGESLLWNGKPFRINGLLHWGYYPDFDGPDPDSQSLRSELLAMQQRGFNLLKACLWLPPHRFLDVCDEVGMAVWVEYPLWNHALPSLDKGDVDVAAATQVLEAYQQFIQHDSAHPCVALRTLSCENDRIDAQAAHHIRQQILRMAPGGMANENSSWIDHSRQPEFWDEHPYLHAAQWPYYLKRTRNVISQREARPLILGETMAFDSLDDEWSRQASVRLRRRQVEQLRQVFPDAGYVICAARDIPQSPLGLQEENGIWKTSVKDWNWQVNPNSPLPTSPAATQPLQIPHGITAAGKLDAATRQKLAAGEIVFHPTHPQSQAWRCPEHTFWSPVASFDAVMPDQIADLKDLLFEDLLGGRGLHAPPPQQARILAAAHDVHDQSGENKVQPFLLAARVGKGRLLISSLRNDNLAGQHFHEILLQRFLLEGESWLKDCNELQIPAPPRSHFLNGPWTLRGDGVQNSMQQIRPGTLLINQGKNAAQSWVDATATISTPQDWTGPFLLRAEAIGDGFELYIDDVLVHTHGRPGFTWDAGRDVPATINLSQHLQPGRSYDWRFRTKDHRGAGVLIGPLYLCNADPAPHLLY